MTRKELAKQAFDECCNEKTTVKYGQKGGFPFWNTEAFQFMYVPAFHFTSVRNIKKYRYTAIDENNQAHSFVADNCCALLTPIWAEIPEGVVRLTVTALNDDGSDYGIVGARLFFRVAPFPEETPKAVCSYKESAIKAYKYAMSQSFMQHWLTEGTPDPTYDLYVYPAKMINSIVRAMISFSSICPEEKEKAMKIAVTAADYLMKITPRGDCPLADLPPTYDLSYCPDPVKYGINTANYQVAGERVHTSMMIYAPIMGSAYILLSKETGDKKYFDEAVKIGNYYKRTMGKDGGWPLILLNKTGEPQCKNNLYPLDSVTPLMTDLYKATGDGSWKEIADKTVKYVEDNYLSVYNWEGQFEDSVLSNNYTNLTMFTPSSLVKYYAENKSDNKKCLNDAIELMRFIEDQFVLWKRPAPWRHRTPEGTDPYDTSVWHTPAGLEQYHWHVPIDSSTSEAAMDFLSLYKVTGEKIYLAKARALMDQITIVQYPDGKIPTHWMNRPDADKHFWINCMFHSCHALCEISKYDKVEL